MRKFLNNLRVGLRKVATGIGRYVISPIIFALFRRPAREEQSTSVHMLVSSQTWHAGLLAVMSLEFFTKRRWRVVIHEDGTVPEAARLEIERRLPGVRFVTRQEADEKARVVFANHPKSLAHRAQFNLFLKFADTLSFADRERFLVLDSDVIFFKTPTEILEWVDTNSKACLYNEDTKEKFCIPREQIELAFNQKLLPRFNSGLVLMQTSAMDPVLAEKFFETFEATAHAPKFFEQTLYALMASTNPGGGAPLPSAYNISWGYLRAPGSICRHYVGDFKHDLLYIEGAPLLLAGLLTKSAK
jgi:hypothetical protein